MATELKHNNIKDLTTDKISPLNYENIFNVYTEDDAYFYNLTKTIVIPEEMDESNYFLYDVKAGDTWPKLSYNIYGDVKVWWLICLANNIFNPAIFPSPGTRLRIINRNVAKSILSTIGNIE